MPPTPTLPLLGGREYYLLEEFMKKQARAIILNLQDHLDELVQS